MGAGQRAGENIQCREELIDVRKSAEGYLSSDEPAISLGLPVLYIVLYLRVSVKWSRLYLLRLGGSWNPNIATKPVIPHLLLPVIIRLVIRRRAMSRSLEHDLRIIDYVTR